MSGPNVEDYPGVAGWQRVDVAGGGGERWRSVDEIGSRHLMLRIGAKFYELHGLTLHVYRGPTGPVDDVWPMGDPSKYDPAVHNFSHEGTYDVSNLLPVTDDEKVIWKWLVQYASHDQAER